MNLRATSKAFRKTVEQQRETWPAELQRLAARAVFSLDAMVLNERNAAAFASSRRAGTPDLQAFDQAYTAWRGA
jgi:hypothetical protein